VADAPLSPERSLPWTLRLVETRPWSPLRLSLVIAGVLLALFATAELTLGRLDLIRAGGVHPRGDFRLAVIMILLVAYLPSAFVLTVRGARRTLEALAPALRCSPAELAELRVEVARFDPGELRRAGLCGVALLLLVPLAANLELWTYAFWLLGPEPIAHRLLLPPIGWFVGRFIYALLVESQRLSRIGRAWVRIDLLDLRRVTPLTRYGLRQALLAMGMLSFVALMLGDVDLAPGLLAIVGGGLAASALLAAGALALPVRGVRAAIVEAKRAELDWCDGGIRRWRGAADEPDGGRRAAASSLADLVAYRSVVAGVNEWPFDVPTLRRLLLYLALPLGSWLGGALVERAVDAVIR
jgi:hypothetical protein